MCLAMDIVHYSPVLAAEKGEEPTGRNLVNVFFRFIDGKVCNYVNCPISLCCGRRNSALSFLLEYSLTLSNWTPLWFCYIQHTKHARQTLSLLIDPWNDDVLFVKKKLLEKTETTPYYQPKDLFMVCNGKPLSEDDVNKIVTTARMSSAALVVMVVLVVFVVVTTTSVRVPQY
jgi:hypothetical protein